MLVSLILYFLLFFLTVVVYPICTYGILSKYNIQKEYSTPTLLLLAFSLSPFITSLLLYYLFMLLPGKSSLFYIVFISFMHLGAAIVICKKESMTLFPQLIKHIKEKHESPEENAIKIAYRDKLFTINTKTLFLIITVVIFSYIGLKHASAPITGHDILEYSIYGKQLGENKKIVYEEFHFNQKNEFFYVGLHGYSFPLLRSWEYLFADVFIKTDADFFYRLVSIYYFLLVYLWGLLLLKKLSLYYHLLWFVFTFLPFGFNSVMLGPHIDSYRICLIGLSFLFLFQSLNSQSTYSIILLGILAGSQAFIHSLGVFIAAIITLSFFIFYKGSFRKKITTTAILAGMIFLMGNFHYVLETVIGTGWIFKEIKFY